MVNPFEEVNRGAESIEPSAGKPVRLEYRSRQINSVGGYPAQFSALANIEINLLRRISMDLNVRSRTDARLVARHIERSVVSSAGSNSTIRRRFRLAALPTGDK
jgi:hypothetical protein